MMFVILAILTYAAATSASSSFGLLGHKVGQKVGADIGLATGSVIDTVPNIIGFIPLGGASGPKSSPPPAQAHGNRDRGSPRRASGGRSYERYDSEIEYSAEKDYDIERTVYERERIKGRNAGRSRASSGRHRSGSY